MSIVNSNEALRNEIETKGQTLYRTNDTYKTLVNLMENPYFRTFYNDYFRDEHMLQVIMMFIDTYEHIEKVDPSLSPYQKIYVLKHLIDNRNTRHQIIQQQQQQKRLRLNDNTSETNDHSCTQ